MKIVFCILTAYGTAAMAQSKKVESPKTVVIHIINESLVYNGPSIHSRATDTMQRGDVVIGLRRYRITVDSQEYLFWHVGNMVGDGYIQELPSYSSQPWNIEYDKERADSVPVSSAPNTSKENAVDKKNLVYLIGLIKKYKEANAKLKKMEAKLQKEEEELQKYEAEHPEERRKYRNNMH